MNKRIALLPLLLSCLAATAAESSFLCTAEEQVVFACELKNKKIVSICASKQLSATAGYVQYRYGTSKAIELEYPSKRELPRGNFFLSTAMYSGGGASSIRFEIGEYEYFVFDRAIRTNFKPGQPNDTVFEAGVATRQKGKTASIRRCTNDASNRAIAYEQLEREEFDDTVFP